MRINIQQEKRFKQKDIDTVKKKFNWDWYPERYNSKDLDAIEVKDRLTLVDFDDIIMPGDKEGNYQPHRLSGMNPKAEAIARSIDTQGYKLGEHPPPALFYSKELGKFEVLTGYTRGGHLLSNYVENFPVTTYRAKEGATEKEVASAKSLYGQAFQDHDPSGDVQKGDVYNEVTRAIDNGWIENELESIKDRVYSQCHMSNTKKDSIVNAVSNQYNPEQTVISWGNASDLGNRKPETFLKQVVGQLDGGTDGVKYHIYTASNPPKTYVSILERYDPTRENRVVLHTGTLKASGNLHEHYENLVYGFIDFFRKIMLIHSPFYKNLAYENQGVGNNLLFGPITLYAVLPALSNHHDLSRLVTFDENGKLFQENA